jgi:hypothetical protein
MAHEHESHECYCPDSGYRVVVDTGVPCRRLTCPEGGSMRAVETGELRGTGQGQSRLNRQSGPINQGEGPNLAWFLVPVLGVGLLLAFAKLSSMKVK